MQTLALIALLLKRGCDSAVEKWSYGRHSKFSLCALGTHMPCPAAFGSATQNVVGWPARSAHVEVQRALQKPRWVRLLVAQKPPVKLQSLLVLHCAPIHFFAISTRTPSAVFSGSRCRRTGTLATPLINA